MKPKDTKESFLFHWCLICIVTNLSRCKIFSIIIMVKQLILLMSDKTQFSCDHGAKNHKICCHDIFPYSWKGYETSGNGRIFSFASIKIVLPSLSSQFWFLQSGKITKTACEVSLWKALVEILSLGYEMFCLFEWKSWIRNQSQGLSSALCYTIPYCFRAVADERVTVPCITTLPLPQPQRVLQHTGVIWHVPEAARIPLYPTTGQWEQPG